MTKPITLTDEQKAGCRRHERNAAPDDDLFFNICPCCGLPEWVSTHRGKTGDTFAELGKGPCATCSEVFYLHPDVCRWVMRVVAARPALLAMLPPPPSPASDKDGS